MTKQNKSWQDKFREQFVKQPVDWRENHGWTVPYVDSRAEKLEKFFENELTALAQKMIEAIPQKESIKPEQDIPTNPFHQQSVGFNSALSQTRQAQMEIIKNLGIEI